MKTTTQPLAFETDEIAKDLAALSSRGAAGHRARVARSYVTYVLDAGKTLIEWRKADPSAPDDAAWTRTGKMGYFMGDPQFRAVVKRLEVALNTAWLDDEKAARSQARHIMRTALPEAAKALVKMATDESVDVPWETRRKAMLAILEFGEGDASPIGLDESLWDEVAESAL